MYVLQDIFTKNKKSKPANKLLNLKREMIKIIIAKNI